MILVVTSTGNFLTVDEGVAMRRSEDVLVCVDANGKRLVAFRHQDIRAFARQTNSDQSFWEFPWQLPDAA